MNHMGTVKIETARLVLRRFTEKDALAVFNNWTSDEKVTEFLRWPAHKSIETTEKVLTEWINSYSKPDFYQWAIVLKENGDEPIGVISVVEKNERLAKVHIGIALEESVGIKALQAKLFPELFHFFLMR